MKLLSTFFFVLISSSITFAQIQNYDHSEEIDNQLWKTFVKAYSSKDTEAYLSIHAKDMLRITKSGIRQGEEFTESIRRSFARKDQPKRTIEFKFEHRVHGKDIAYEVGYFKVTYFRDGKEEDYFGRFSVVLRKEDNRWRIAQDWDIDRINGVPITEEDYLKLSSKIISKE